MRSLVLLVFVVGCALPPLPPSGPGGMTEAQVDGLTPEQLDQAAAFFLGHGLLGPPETDAYGWGVHADATGRAFTWQPQHGGFPVLGGVVPDAYGLGVGMDDFGRPVVAEPWP